MMYSIAWDDIEMVSLLVAIESVVINENKSTIIEQAHMSLLKGM